MGLYKNYLGSSGSLPKPRKALLVDNAVFSRTYLHNSESLTGFKWSASRLNFLMEIMKFFPTFEQVGYAGEEVTDFAAAMGEFGSAAGSAFWVGEPPRYLWTEGMVDEAGNPVPMPTSESDGDYYRLDDNGNPIHKRANTPWDDGKAGRAYTRDHFGAWHRVVRPGRNDLPWGFFEGQSAENLDFHPAVSEYNHFTSDSGNQKYAGIERLAQQRAQTTNEGWEIDAALNEPYYDSLFDFDTADYSNMWDGDTVLYSYNDAGEESGSKTVLSGGAMATLESYGNMSFYQIVMSGFNNGATISYNPTTNDDGSIKESVSWNNESGFVYDNEGMAGEHGEGAFKLMLGLLESRRRIFAGMTEIFGSNQDIAGASGPNDQALINAFNSWGSDPARGLGADPHNVALFSMFLYAQHSLHSVLPAFSYKPEDWPSAPGESHGGFPGWIYSGKDQLAFNRFNIWMNSKVQEYKDYVNDLTGDFDGLPEYQDAVTDLIDEFYAETVPDGEDYGIQPYIKTQSGSNNGEKIGWDRYSQDFDEDGARGHGNPIAPGPHREYVVSQLNGINMAGNRNGLLVHNGVQLNLSATNWAVHHVMGLLRYVDKDIGRTLAINTHNRRNSMKYKKETEDYHEAKMDLKYQEMLDAAKNMESAARRKSEINKLAGKAKMHAEDLKKMESAAKRSRLYIKSLAKANKHKGQNKR